MATLSASERARLDAAEVILWGSYCGVHTVFKPEHVAWWRDRGYRVVVHPGRWSGPELDAAVATYVLSKP